MGGGCRDWTGVSGSLPGSVCCVQAVVVCVLGGGVSGRSPWMIVGGLSARSEGRGGVCATTEV